MIVLDTHIWVRWLDPEADPLPASLVEKIAFAESLAVSAITCWEVAWLHRRERIALKLPLNAWMDHALQGSEVVRLPAQLGKPSRPRGCQFSCRCESFLIGYTR